MLQGVPAAGQTQPRSLTLKHEGVRLSHDVFIGQGKAFLILKAQSKVLVECLLVMGTFCIGQSLTQPLPLLYHAPCWCHICCKIFFTGWTLPRDYSWAAGTPLAHPKVNLPYSHHKPLLTGCGTLVIAELSLSSLAT